MFGTNIEHQYAGVEGMISLGEIRKKKVSHLICSLWFPPFCIDSKGLHRPVIKTMSELMCVNNWPCCKRLRETATLRGSKHQRHSRKLTQLVWHNSLNVYYLFGKNRNRFLKQTTFRKRHGYSSIEEPRRGHRRTRTVIFFIFFPQFSLTLGDMLGERGNISAEWHCCVWNEKTFGGGNPSRHIRMK